MIYYLQVATCAKPHGTYVISCTLTIRYYAYRIIRCSFNNQSIRWRYICGPCGCSNLTHASPIKVVPSYCCRCYQRRRQRCYLILKESLELWHNSHRNFLSPSSSRSEGTKCTKVPNYLHNNCTIFLIIFSVNYIRLERKCSRFPRTNDVTKYLSSD